MCVCMYIYIYCTVNMGLKVSEKFVFLTSFFGCGGFQGNLFSFEKQVVTKDLYLEIHHNGFTFFLTAIDEI